MHTSAFQNMATLFGRLLFCAIFLVSSIGKILHFDTTVTYMTTSGIPHAELLAPLAIIFEFLGGLMLLLGWHTRFGALLLLIFTALATVGIHHFWTYSGTEMMGQLINFEKNTTIIGGALYILAFGAGAYSMDGRKRKTM